MFISTLVVLLAVFLLLKKSTRPFGFAIIIGILFLVSYGLIVDSAVPLLGFVLAAMGVTGLIGAFLGSLVNKGVAGFFLGFFLGPIGWIIVFLLPRETSINPQTPTMDDINKLAERTKTAQERLSSQTQTPKERPPRDLASDAYKIWLGKKYEVTRNELFDNFECDEKLFESLDDALKYADELEAQERQRLEAQQAIETRNYPNGDVYVGEFRNGQRNGQGTFIFGPGDFEGDVFVGEFRDDQRNGQGTLTFADGRIQSGLWRNNQFQGSEN